MNLRRLAWDFARRAMSAPAIDNVQVVMSTVAVRLDQGMCWLGLGDRNAEATAGYRFTCRATGRRRRGRIEFVQLVQLHRTRSPGESGQTEEKSSDGEWTLDTEDPYGGVRFNTRINPRQAATGGTYDSPRSAMIRYIMGANDTAVPIAPFERVTADDTFRTFIMWRPSGPLGIFRISLGYIEWSWSGAATASAAPGDCTCASSPTSTTSWTLSPLATPPSFTAHIGALVRPTYTRNAKDIPWRPV